MNVHAIRNSLGTGTTRMVHHTMFATQRAQQFQPHAFTIPISSSLDIIGYRLAPTAAWMRLPWLFHQPPMAKLLSPSEA